MKILLQSPRDRAAEWHAALTSALPDATVAAWPDAPASPDYALVWKPPAELFIRARPTRAIFNLGAGVDALMTVPTLPDDVPVIRLEDAGMAEQMAEYVAFAVLRAYREMDAYAAQQRDGRLADAAAHRQAVVRRRFSGLRRAGQCGVEGAAAVRVSALRMEPHAQGVGGRGLVRRHRGARRVPREVARPRLPAARNGGHDVAARSRRARGAAVRRAPRQRRARRHRRRRGPDCASRQRTSRRRDARRVSRRAAAAAAIRSGIIRALR